MKKNKRPHLLLCNDDGVRAPGLFALWRALKKADFADITIVAPAHEKSGAGVSLTWSHPLLIKKFDWASHARAQSNDPLIDEEMASKTAVWSVDGSPADCIKMAMRLLIDFLPDSIVSGINAGSNAGRNVLHSGTVGAVIEGALRNIPGVAFSCEDGQKPNFHVAEKYIADIVQYQLAHPLPTGTILNVNFPHACQEEVRGFKFTRQGMGRWIEDPLLHLEDESGDLSYWLGGKPEEFEEQIEGDISLLREGYMTAVPIHVHDLTDQSELLLRKKVFEDFLEKKRILQNCD